LAAGGTRDESGTRRNWIFGARFDRVTGISVASKNAARYVEPLLDPDDTEEQLV